MRWYIQKKIMVVHLSMKGMIMEKIKISLAIFTGKLLIFCVESVHRGSREYVIMQIKYFSDGLLPTKYFRFSLEILSENRRQI